MVPNALPVRKRLPISCFLLHDPARTLWLLRNTSLHHLLSDNLSEKIQTTICFNDELTTNCHEVIALFLHQHSWYM
jgi:hypothetical protein